MKRIVAIGANVYDTLICTPYYPAEDTKLKAGKLIKCGGGPAATGIVAAARLGADCAFIGNMSKDEGGRFLKESFERFGVNTDQCEIKDGCESFASFVLLSDRDKTRTCVFDKGSVPPLKLNERQKDTIINSGLLMVDGNELEAAVEAAALARENGVDVLYDAGGLYDNVERLLAVSNIIIPSLEFALGFTGADSAEEAAHSLYEQFKPDVIVITDGKNGGYLFENGEVSKYPAFKVDAVDTNGAGDVFHGAFAFALINGYGYEKACIFSSAVSALKCTRLGARDGVPSYAETVEFLKKNNCPL